MTPSWLTDLLAGLMLVVAGYCVGRLVYARLRHRPTDHDVDVLHVFMGVAMAGMLVSRLSILDSRVWETLFALAALWFVARAVLAFRSAAAAGHQIPYVLASAAMLYMYFAPIATAGSPGSGSMSGISGVSGMSGMSDASDTATAASRFPLLGLVLVVSMIVYAVLAADRTALVAAESASAPAPSSASLPQSVPLHCGHLAPRAANCCHIAMSVTMAYLLVVML